MSGSTVDSLDGPRGKHRQAGARRWLPEEAAAFLHRRLREALGLLLIGFGVVWVLSLLTYDPADPSFNTATGGEPAVNLLGTAGAYAADLAIQGLGAAAFVLGLVPAAWGLRLLNQIGLGRLWLRLTGLMLHVPLLAVALAPLPPPAPWAGQASLGGVLGTLLNGILAAGLMPPDGSGGTGLASLAAAVPAGAALLLAMGLSGGDWAWLGRRSGRGLGWSGRTLGRGLWAGLTGTVALSRRVTQWLADWRANRRDRDAVAGNGPAEAPNAAPEGQPASARAAPTREEPVPDAPPAQPAAPAAPERRGAVVAPKPPPVSEGRRAGDERQGSLNFADDDGDYQLPPLDLLQLPDPTRQPASQDQEGLSRNAEMLEGVLKEFGVRGTIGRVNPGPVVTLYELEPAPGTKSSRVIGLADDIARSMSAVSVRVAVVPGKNAIGIELPNATREIVFLREILASRTMEKHAGKLTLVLGKDIGGHPILADLARMPHLLVAGTTGSGKSVAINTMILSLLYRLPPDRVRLILVDPKMLELSVYDGIPHLLSPVVTDPKKAVVALKWAVREMEDRYRAMSKLGVRNIEGYNQRLREARSKGEVLMRRVQTGFDPDTGKPIYEEEPLDLTELPYIVVVVDEMADLMLVAGKDIEAAIQRLAQMARAAGIHLIMATQRPSVDVITGTIKANFPTRISFQVTSKVDSRTILGEGGAEQLLGLGDMLYMIGGGRISRVHGPFVSDGEVEEVVRFLKTQGEPDYNDSVLEDDDEAAAFDAFGEVTGGGVGGAGGSSGDDLYDQAVALVARERKASTSFVQRHLQP
ncbi:MAG: cell division protein FtsK, partial [Alphaproteobacteria bacterium]|nr:cell division protein FtsK [Alphaproteobacteria bacterium]